MQAITINIEDEGCDRVLGAIAERFGYTGFLADGVTVQTKAEFTKAKLIDFLKKNVVEHEAHVAAADAYALAHADAMGDIILT